MTERIDPDEHRDHIGTSRTENLGTITRREVRRYARAVEDDNPLFTDVEYARSKGYDDLVIPPNMLSSIVEPGAGAPVSELGEGGMISTGGVEPDFPEGLTSMAGDREMTFHRYATAGDTITKTTTFDDIYQKESSSMGTLTFTAFLEEYVDAAGEPVVTNRWTRIRADPQ